MQATVEDFRQLLMRSRLVPAEEVIRLHRRWLQETQSHGTSPADFADWLVRNGHVTEYQAKQLLRGHADHFFLNDYKLLDRIGKGRMAGVYKAIHRNSQVVAIKILPPSKAAKPETLGRFQREARLAMRLKHPNVVRTFASGEVNGLHYLVMEYLDGEILEDVLERRGRLPSDEVIRLAQQALLGMQHLHEEGIVHRDIKPANLILVPARDPAAPDTTLSATVKILDVGLGRALFDEAAEDEEMVVTHGSPVGTMEYMAPEQVRDSHFADTRSDLYSFGCVLYQMLAGEPPFRDRNPKRLLEAVLTKPPRPLGSLSPPVQAPAELEGVISCLLSKDAAQRYATPEQAAKALGRSLARPSVNESVGLPPRTAPPGVPAATMIEVDPHTLQPMRDRLSIPAKPVQASLETNEMLPRTAADSIPPRSLLEMNGRDFLFLCFGAMGVLLAEACAWIVKLVFTR
jgi:serine/threonine protein kinase